MHEGVFGKGSAVLTKYIDAAMRHAHYEILPDDGTVYGEILDTQGVWANADTVEACRDELREVLEDWLLLGFRRQITLPVIDGIDLNARAVA